MSTIYILLDLRWNSRSYNIKHLWISADTGILYTKNKLFYRENQKSTEIDKIEFWGGFLFLSSLSLKKFPYAQFLMSSEMHSSEIIS